MTTPHRIALALAACAGLNDAELAKRGQGAFFAMIDRKRKYAAAARILAVTNELLAKELAQAKKALAAAQAELAEIKALDAPVGDTTQALSMLTALAHKPGAPGASAA